MRPIALALAATLVIAGCGGDEPDEAPATARQPAPTRPLTDTTLGDTTAPGAVPGQRPAGQGAAEGSTGGTEAGAEQRAGTVQPSGRTAAGRTGTGRAGGAAGAGDAAGGERVYTVQVAAFTESESASEWAARLRSQGLPVWTSLTELGGRTFYRVRVGATPRFSEARQLGQMLTDRYEWPVWVAPLSPADRLPENAVRDTRSVLQGG